MSKGQSVKVVHLTWPIDMSENEAKLDRLTALGYRHASTAPVTMAIRIGEVLNVIVTMVRDEEEK